MKIEKPQTGEYAPYTINYIELVDAETFSLQRFADNAKITVDFVESLPQEKLLYRYADGKWTIKQIIVHIIDAERIFAYRALRFARNDKTDLSGFEQDDYVAASNANERDIHDILDEFAIVRNSTIALFRSFDENDFTKIGTANGNQASVRALAYMIAGHELHHLNVFKERYL